MERRRVPFRTRLAPQSLCRCTRRIGLSPRLRRLARLGTGVDPESEVHTIGVDPGSRRRGIGKALLTELLRVADRWGGPVFLEVRTDNDAAIALYRREGFEVVGTRKRYYQPSGADAYTMRRPDRREEPRP